MYTKVRRSLVSTFPNRKFPGIHILRRLLLPPMGTPEDDDPDMWAEKHIKGWVRTACDANVTSVLVGPRPLVGIPWLTGAEQHV